MNENIPKIIPAIMPDDWEELEEKIKTVSNLVPMVQIDVMDGVFTDSVSWPYNHNEHFDNLTKQLEGLPGWQKLDFSVDLMVSNPFEEALKWAEAGVAKVIIHFESISESELGDLISELSDRQIMVGIALSTQTSFETIRDYLDEIDFVQFMGINNIGYQGEEFVDSVLSEISNLRAEFPDLIIQVDGGVNLDNAKDLFEAGANSLISGSALFDANGGNFKENLKQFEQIVDDFHAEK